MNDKLIPSSKTSFIVILGFLACILSIVYLYYAFILPQTPGRIGRPSISLIPELPLWSFIVSLPIPIPGESWLVAISLIIITVIGFTAYSLAIWISWHRQICTSSIYIIVSATLLFFLISVLALPNANTDIYNYILSARVATAHGSNPYYVPPDQFPDDPIYPYAGHQYTSHPDVKLPTWMLISMPLTILAGDDVTTNLLVFRFAFLLFNIANLTIIAVILYKLNPQHLLVGVILYAWNPIIIVYGQSKTDTVMAFFLLLASLLLITKRRWLAVISMTLSVFVKLITLPYVIIYFIRDLRLKKWSQSIIDVLLFGAVILVLYIPFLKESGLIYHHLSLVGVGAEAAPAVIRFSAIMLFVLLVLWTGFRQDGSIERLLYSWAVVSLFFSLFLVKNISFSWYLITLIAIVSLISNWYIIVATIVLSFYTFLLNIWHTVSTSTFPLHNPFPLSRLFIYSMFVFLVVSAITAFMIIKSKVFKTLH